LKAVDTKFLSKSVKVKKIVEAQNHDFYLTSIISRFARNNGFAIILTLTSFRQKYAMTFGSVGLPTLPKVIAYFDILFLGADAERCISKRE